VPVSGAGQWAKMTGMPALVAIIMGSQSDWETLAHASQTLDGFEVTHDVRVLSAHRTPDQLVSYVESIERNGVEVIIAGAGGAAALPGAIAAKTTLPVLGVPIESKLNGLDSLLSMVQMPAGVPVGTLAIGRAGAVNAALLAVSILAVKRPDLRESLRRHRETQAQRVLAEPDPRRRTKT
jgi:5-(carboxyamino)imidazole ribonucleotide mutase